MHLLSRAETRYLVIAYLPQDARRLQLEGPILVETRDYVHFYLTGTKLQVETIAYVVVRDYPMGTTEDQATDFFINSYNELLRETMRLEDEANRPIPVLAQRKRARAA